MKGLGILAGVIAFLCMVMGVLTFFEVGFLEDIPSNLTDWTFWFWLSALLFLANIACIAGGGRRGGGEEY
jgi:hypothetical protein